jgi:outer membrane protein assembly factor BamA
MKMRTSIHQVKALLSAVMILAALSPIGLSQQAADPDQESRQGIEAAEEAEKAKKTRPPVLSKAEALFFRFQTIFVEDPSGFYPSFDTVYSGGGLTLGAGYRRFFGDNTYWNVRGLYSFRNYKLAEAATESKDQLGGRLSFGGRLGWRDATQVAYYGLGMTSTPEDRANFRFQETYVDGHALLRPKWWIPLKGSVAYEHWNTLEGQGSDPSIETVYTPVTAPGLGADPTYLHTQFSAGIDWRQAPGYTRKGGLYQASFHDYRNNNGGIYSFQRLDAEVIQHFPLLRETWVLAVRGRVQTTLNDSNLVPYFLLPVLGSGSTLRGYATDRFRDLNSLLINAEFRWIPTSFLDMAFFYDAGKVTNQRGDLNFEGLTSDVGIGVRLHGPLSTPLRIDVAVSNEGWRLVFSGSPPF